MNANVELLYQENIGCGLDTESNTPNGASVSLTLWTGGEGCDSWYIKDHYVLCSWLTLDHHCVLENQNIFDVYAFSKAKMIRSAIEEFDRLVKQIDVLEGEK